MNKRYLTKYLAGLTLLIMSGLGSGFGSGFGFTSLVQAQESKYQDGVHYTTIENAPAPQAGIVEVVEAFSYMCNHCATFEPYVQNWLKRLPESVKFLRYPVVFGRGTWELYARAYNTADLMGVADKAHAALMDKIWKDRQILKTMEELAEFYVAYGVDPAVFLTTSKSFAVDAKMRREQRFLMDSGVNSTPNIVVNGKYLVAGNAAVANYDQLLGVVDYLVGLELASIGTAATAAPADAAAETSEGAKEDVSAEITEEAATAEVAEEN